MAIPVLTLRPEFHTAALKGTAIELATRSKTGATQIPAADFLNITYPSHDLIKALQAASSDPNALFAEKTIERGGCLLVGGKILGHLLVKVARRTTLQPARIAASIIAAPIACIPLLMPA
jgi:hypothetical protein